MVTDLKNMNILFTDLDNTLIYSSRVAIKEKICVELYKGEANSFMSAASYRLIKILKDRLHFIPLTTRTVTQYMRINLNIDVKYALCANGGILLKNGTADKVWYENSLSILEDSYDERQRAGKYLRKASGRCSECRNIDDLFIFTKCEDAAGVADDLRKQLDMSLVDVCCNREKLYVIPKRLNKGKMAERFINHICEDEFNKGTDIIYAAGDTEFDIGMVELADMGFVHRDMGYTGRADHICSEYEGLFSDFYLGKVLKNEMHSRL